MCMLFREVMFAFLGSLTVSEIFVTFEGEVL